MSETHAPSIKVRIRRRKKKKKKGKKEGKKRKHRCICHRRKSIKPFIINQSSLDKIYQIGPAWLRSSRKLRAIRDKPAKIGCALCLSRFPRVPGFPRF